MDPHLKPAKGTRDYTGADRILLEEIITETEEIYQLRGGVPFDTPMFELKSILMNKYGEDSKLIYDLADQGGEACALRYDLTVPFARYLAQTKTQKIKRYHTGKVFRRDQPALAKGRYREFFQSDFDIVGDYAHMTADAEIVGTAREILRHFTNRLETKEYFIRVNHKKLIDAMLNVCGIDKSIQKSIGSSIDKLDKCSWEEVRKEMVEKGATEPSVDKLKKLISIQGPLETLLALQDTPMAATEEGKEALDDLNKLFELLTIYGQSDNIVIDLSLVRGLDYYTGIVLEGGITGYSSSLVAGGRYDNLVQSLLEPAETLPAKKPSKTPQPPVKCVGVSLGVSRLFSLIQPTQHQKKTHTQVLVCSVGPGLLEERLRVCVYLRDNNIRTEYFMGNSANFTRHSEYAESLRIKVLVLIGRKELEKGEYQILWGDKSERHKKTVSKEELVPAIKLVLASFKIHNTNPSSSPVAEIF
ncbi:histidyl-tRNA synthetase [Nematocida sp. AWRm80]|nr:histidyl-tRNA synthetase [Nematocida sp. AWRm80]